MHTTHTRSRSESQPSHFVEWIIAFEALLNLFNPQHQHTCASLRHTEVWCGPVVKAALRPREVWESFWRLRGRSSRLFMGRNEMCSKVFVCNRWSCTREYRAVRERASQPTRSRSNPDDWLSFALIIKTRTVTSLCKRRWSAWLAGVQKV